MGRPKAGTTARDRFEAGIDRSGDCHLWTRATDSGGYGHFRVDGKLVSTHIWAWEQEHGPVPEGLELAHRCPNKACADPEHVRPLTHQENIVEHWREQRTTCRNGHPHVGGGYCPECKRLRWSRRRAVVALRAGGGA